MKFRDCQIGLKVFKTSMTCGTPTRHQSSLIAEIIDHPYQNGRSDFRVMVCDRKGKKFDVNISRLVLASESQIESFAGE